MRNIYIITLLVSLLFSPSWGETLTINDLVTRNNLYYKKFTDIPFTGEISGKESGKFKKGKKEGKWVYYHENGQLRIKINYKNGNLNRKGNFKRGKKHGLWERYYKTGKLEYKINYKDGIKDGLEEEYFTTGKLMSKGTYKGGKKNGLFEYYTNNGLIEKTESWKNGVKQE